MPKDTARNEKMRGRHPKSARLLLDYMDILAENKQGNTILYIFISKDYFELKTKNGVVGYRLMIRYGFPAANRVDNVRIGFRWLLQDDSSKFYLDVEDKIVYDYTEKNGKKYHRPAHFSDDDVVQFLDDEITLPLEELINKFQNEEMKPDFDPDKLSQL
ncbi:MAG: hypothetical protein KIG14_02005 [Candidatus Sacchiramonaceae bacterium]|nr:hypothetical protein [Candidatus Saccharimonadaceae bacterium]